MNTKGDRDIRLVEIVKALSKKEMLIADLARVFKTSYSTIKEDLKLLESEIDFTKRKVGYSTYYKIDYEVDKSNLKAFERVKKGGTKCTSIKDIREVFKKELKAKRIGRQAFIDWYCAKFPKESNYTTKYLKTVAFECGIEVVNE